MGQAMNYKARPGEELDSSFTNFWYSTHMDQLSTFWENWRICRAEIGASFSGEGSVL